MSSDFDLSETVGELENMVDAARDAGMPAVEVEMDLADELAPIQAAVNLQAAINLVQAAVNLAAIYGITVQELDAALTRCRERNREGGDCND